MISETAVLSSLSCANICVNYDSGIIRSKRILRINTILHLNDFYTCQLNFFNRVPVSGNYIFMATMKRSETKIKRKKYVKHKFRFAIE